MIYILVRNIFQLEFSATLGGPTFFSTTSLHGVQYLESDKNKLARLYWFVLLLTAAVFALWIAINGVKNEETLLKIETDVEKNYDELFWKLPLPSVTLCVNQNPEKWQFTRTVLNQLPWAFFISENDDPLFIALRNFLNEFETFNWLDVSLIGNIKNESHDNVEYFQKILGFTKGS